MFRYTCFETRFGWIAILASEKGLRRTSLPQPTQESALLSLGTEVDRADRSDAYFADLASKFTRYFNGREEVFEEALDLAAAGAFAKSVWQATSRIQYGQTRTYAWVAREIGRPLAARAVGTALGRNPLPIIVPCHRVIGSDGNLRGFGGGLPMKQRLIDLEMA